MPYPDLLKTDGDFDDVIRAAYLEFCDCFKKNPPRKVRGKPLVHDDRVLSGNCCEGFWHIVERGPDNARLFDPRRAARIGWIKEILFAGAGNASRFAYNEGSGQTKLYYWLEEENFVVILAERPRVVALVTAFYIDRDWLKKDLERRRENGTPI